jgi:type I restriction enzyme S subunit
LINKTDILVVWDGARFGLTGMGMDGAAGSTLMVLTPVLNKPEYIYNFINRHYSYINSKPKGTGTPHVNPDIFWKLQFPIAPLNEQKRIVARLDKIMPRIDAVKECLNKVPTIIKRFKQSVLTAAVTGKLTEKWRAEYPDVESAFELCARIKKYKKEWAIIESKKGNSEAKRALSKLKDETHFDNDGIPKTWENRTLLDSCHLVVDCHNKTAPYQDAGVYLVRTSNIKNGKIVYENMKFVSEKTYNYWSKRCYPEPGDILFTREAPMGEAAIIPEKTKICLGQRTMLLRMPKNLLNNQYVLYCLLDPNMFKQIDEKAIGSGVHHLRVGDVETLSIPIPPLEEQTEIVRQVDKLFILADKLESHYQKAKARVDKLSQSVLAKAFCGELVVTEAELAEKEGRDFESAEKLLERILKEKAKLVGSRQRRVGAVRSARGSKGKQKETGGKKI